MTPPTLTVADEGAVRILTIDRPRSRNAFDSALCESLVDALRAAAQSERTSAIVITSTGGLFSAGADLQELKADPSEAAAESRSARYVDLLTVVQDLRLPVVCAVEGRAIGLGAAFAWTADFLVAGASAQFSFPEVRHGMAPGLMIAPVLRACGRLTAFELLAAARPLTSQRALALGLVNCVVDDGTALAHATTVASELAGLDRQALGDTKHMLDQFSGLSLLEGLKAGVESGRLRRQRKASPAH